MSVLAMIIFGQKKKKKIEMVHILTLDQNKVFRQAPSQILSHLNISETVKSYNLLLYN